jgi:hypothetical protein
VNGQGDNGKKITIFNLQIRQVATYLTVVLMIVYTLITMGVTIQDTKNLKIVWIKTNEQQLFHQLEEEYGFSKAVCRSLFHLMNEFIDKNYGNLRSDTQIIYQGAIAIQVSP